MIAASGTGGHIFPALAVAEYLTDWEITWLGVPGRLEERLVKGRYPLIEVDVTGLAGPPGLGWVWTGLKLLQAAGRVRGLLTGFQGVFSTGGYIAAPALLAAASLGLPALVHESNALPGKVTRLLARWTRGVGLGFAEAVDYLPGVVTRWVGTPVRPDFWTPSPLVGLDLDPGATMVLAMGGSQGARGVNRLVCASAPQWLAAGAWVVHLTGPAELATCQATLQHPHYLPIAFWEQMSALLYRADLVITRAGAVSLSEVCATGRASVLIPYPYAADDHQAVNAQTLVDRGAALMFREATLTAEVLTRTVLALLAEPQTCQRMGQIAQSLVKPHAAAEMAQWLRAELTG
ncbi:undecaprenyldiphospho-muramoylpentapeptide beta-N-acetylglucosaminyltransferase [Candidatus Cyanaurora vandensis]|uniref:undecaprenyldiphospho-muramoylpentapeptide beta-N-acetylglucosaminyltransferase n=2 Tax=Candidatus Cyanaurora vandensis TaxID=2714958 RepID=UPI00257BC154|nr:undecaprenyldiphospho-muramoylpentapeptide beta-N-acetylglucosaminyltransferase [Candidatus Cyanaurora vandensis]